MSRQGQDSDVARGMSAAAAKGAGLVLLAIIIGVVALQIVDDGDLDDDASNGTAQTTTTTQAERSTTTVAPTTTTQGEPAPTREPAEVRLIVLNAGAAAGAAGEMSDALREKGYTAQELAADWTGVERTGNTVFCKEDFEGDAAALAVAVGEGTATEPFPEQAPPGSGNVDCVVARGADAT
jgi:hypothetical protein